MKCAVFDEWLCSMLLGNKPIIIGQVINIWKSYMRTAGWRIIWKKFIATFAVAKRKPEKIQAGGIRTLDLCDTGVALYQYWANKPTWSRSLNWFVINPWKDDDEVMNIWKSYMRTAGWRINGRGSPVGKSTSLQKWGIIVDKSWLVLCCILIFNAICG